MRKFYIYYWFNKEKNNEVFYIGKGKENRYLVKNRNIYFNRTYEKYDCYPVIMINNLTEVEAFELEKEHITFWKNMNQAKTNLHEGGYGGDVFKYNPEGKKAMIEKNRISNSGKNGGMYGKNWKDFSTKEIIANHPEKCRQGQIKRYKSNEERIKTGKASKKHWNKSGVKERYHKNNSRKWYQYDLNGNYIRTFEDGGKVLEFLNMKGHMTLMKNMKLKKPYKKYYWIREEEKGVETIEKESNYFHLVE